MAGSVRRAVAAWVLVGVLSVAHEARSQAPSAGVVENPCPPPLERPGALNRDLEMMLDPSKTSADPALSRPQDTQAYYDELGRRAASDWPNLCRYRDDNLAVRGRAPHRPRVVFIGDSITEFWSVADPLFFDADVIDRGISGQTTSQMLVRFRADVVALRPAVVHIMAGTNDIAGNSGPMTLADIENNIMSMVDIARANGIKVVLGSVPPADAFSWRPGVAPAGTIRSLNDWLIAYAEETGATYVDYYTPLATPSGALRSDFSQDGVHPNRAGYAVMEPLARKAVSMALGIPVGRGR